ncbi:hypothetical protein ACQP2X_13395 [Actinoplanes sp. CA-131856]
MRRRAKQIWADIRQRRHIDLYATTLVALVFAALLLVGADLPESVRWSLLFAAVGSNLLTDERCDLLRRGPLAREGGIVRVVVLKQFQPRDAISEQLDALLDHPVQKAAESLRETRARLAAMEKWQVNGTFAYGEIAFNPGFSLVAVNPHGAGGYADVEFHGFRNDAVRSRMHIHLTRDDGAWYLYWLDQFEAIWRSARE